jgi:hypothetical protein
LQARRADGRKDPAPITGGAKVKKILFKPEMVRAILAGVKTQTRRIHANMEKPRYKVRETVYVGETYSTTAVEMWPGIGKIIYFADGRISKPTPMACWKSGMFMPEKYARIFLKITGAKKQNLVGILPQEAQAEGFNSVKDFYEYFYSLPKNENASYDAEVWAYTFEVAKR